MKKPRLIIGCRARILTLREKPTRKGPNFFANEDHWRKEYGKREVLLLKRSHDRFSVMLLGKRVKELKRKDPKTVDGSMAWVPEEDMVLVNRKFCTNLSFMDWYQENEDNFCGDCGAWRPNDSEGYGTCLNKKCPGNHLEDYEDHDD